MSRATILILRLVIALALAGSVVVQAFLLPLIWVDLEGVETASRVAFVVILGLGVATMQVFGVCVWQLLTRVRRGSIFSESSFRIL